MPRLNDRAFQIVKNEIERCYKDGPEAQIERVILLSRLETLRTYQGKPMTRVEIWEVLSDVAPNFSQDVLLEAESVDTDSPLLGVSMGIGAVAALVSAAIGVDSTPVKLASASPVPTASLNRSSENTIQVSTVNSAGTAAEIGFEKAQPEPTFQMLSQNQADSLRRLLSLKPNESATLNNRRPVPLNEQTDHPFQLAMQKGWQAAIKGQNPPHSAQHWGETAALWSRAIAHLEQVQPKDSYYAAAQLKKSIYQQNLQQIRSHQAAALKIAQDEQKQRSQSVAHVVIPSPNQSPHHAPQFSTQPAENLLDAAKRYGWQASVASQNAPHPAEKWADISRLWQAALKNLNSIDRAHPAYAEAQKIKARYEQNLTAIRDRYQKEQTAAQRLQSLQATLAELDYSILPNATEASRLASIIEKLKSIPSGTQAYAIAQPLIADATKRMGEVAAQLDEQLDKNVMVSSHQSLD